MSANLDWLKMVQNANGGPLPLVNRPYDFIDDPNATPGTQGYSYGATQQGVGTRGNPALDTGWSSLQPGDPNAKPGDPGWRGSVDYANPGTARLGNPDQPAPGFVGTTGSNDFGYSYSNPGQGFNPWGLYDGGTGYKGGDGVGLYDPAKDSAKGWGPNGQTETDRDRVWRMTLDDLKAKGLDPGSADAATVQAAFLQNVARLHRDYDNTQGLGAQAWANSAFAGYDKLAGGTGSQAGTATQGTGQRGQTGTAASGGQPGQTGGNGVIPDKNPQQDTSPTGGGATGNPPGYGQTSDPNALGGGTGGIDQLYQNDQAYRTAQLLKALGLGDINSRMSYGGSVIASRAPGLFEAWREAQGVGGGGVANGLGQTGAFANIYNSPGALGNFAQAGQHGLEWLMGQGGQGLKDQEVIPLIQAFQQLTGINQSDTQQRFSNNLTDQGLGQFLQGIGSNNVTQRLVPYLQSNPLFGFLTGKH